MPQRNVLVWLALATVYVAWGASYLAIRVLVETVPPLLGAGLRFVVAGALFAGWLVARHGIRALRVSRRELAAAAGIGTLLLAGGNGGVTIAEQDAPAGLASLIIASVPLWVVLLRLLWRERVPAATLGGVGLGFVGVALLVVPGDRPGNAPLWSLLVLIAAAASWGSGSFLTSRVPLPRDLLVATTLEMLLGGALMIAAGLIAGEASEFDLASVSGRSVVGFVYLVTVGSLLAFTAFVWLLKNVPVSTVATYAFVNPVVAVLLGWAILDEEITTSIVVAAIVIVASVAFVVRKETTRPAAHTAAPGEVAEALDAAEPH
jgi:drug/metabolite transporter (DMT)-like permease